MEITIEQAERENEKLATTGVAEFLIDKYVRDSHTLARWEATAKHRRITGVKPNAKARSRKRTN